MSENEQRWEVVEAVMKEVKDVCVDCGREISCQPTEMNVWK